VIADADSAVCQWVRSIGRASPLQQRQVNPMALRSNPSRAEPINNYIRAYL
jgi:hypothetical protein